MPLKRIIGKCMGTEHQPGRNVTLLKRTTYFKDTVGQFFVNRVKTMISLARSVLLDNMLLSLGKSPSKNF